MNRSVVAAVLFVLAITGCGGGSKIVDLTPVPNSEILKRAPNWFTDVPQDPNYLFAAATATSSDMQLAINKAQTEGRNQLAQQMEVKFNGLQKRFQEEVGVGDGSEYLDQFTLAYKSVVSTVLHGSRISKQDLQQERQIWRSYVLMEMPIGEANQQLMAKIKANQNLYTRFRATEAFDELDDEIDRFEQWKKNQGN